MTDDKDHVMTEELLQDVDPEDPIAQAIILATHSLNRAHDAVVHEKNIRRIQTAVLALLLIVSFVFLFVVRSNTNRIGDEAVRREILICSGFTFFTEALLGDDPSAEGIARAEALFNNRFDPLMGKVDCTWPPGERTTSR